MKTASSQIVPVLYCLTNWLDQAKFDLLSMHFRQRSVKIDHFSILNKSVNKYPIENGNNRNGGCIFVACMRRF